jgi:hypothetical protein
MRRGGLGGVSVMSVSSRLWYIWENLGKHTLEGEDFENCAAVRRHNVADEGIVS